MNAHHGPHPSTRLQGSIVRVVAIALFSLLPPIVAGAATRERALTTKTAERKTSPSLASLPPPAASGPLRILLVDDDVSDNNNAARTTRESQSDTILGDLVSASVGDRDDAWSIERVQANSNGPELDRLRPFPLVIWYTGASYGGNPDNSAALSLQDEKTVRRYLEEVGGVVVLISPGYAERVLDRASSWEDSTWPFLTEVLGIRGGLGLAQRFLPGTVLGVNGQAFQVGRGSAAVESQFSLVHPDGAAVVFTTTLTGTKGGGQPAPVATAFSYGRGRIIYVGFTFENLAQTDLKPAFRQLLAATGLPFAQGALPQTPAVASTPSIAARDERRDHLPPITPPADVNGSAPLPAISVVPNTQRKQIALPQPPATPAATPPATQPAAKPVSYYLTSVKISIKTGNDNKELQSVVGATLHNGISTNNNVTNVIYNYNESFRDVIRREFSVNSTNEIVMYTDNSITTAYDINNIAMNGWRDGEISLNYIQDKGLTLNIWYSPNFLLDAWKIDSVSMTVQFKDAQGNSHPTLGEKTILFSRSSALLNESNRELVLGIDGFLMQRF